LNALLLAMKSPMNAATFARIFGNLSENLTMACLEETPSESSYVYRSLMIVGLREGVLTIMNVDNAAKTTNNGVPITAVIEMRSMAVALWALRHD
jgi:hypothetical protein